MGLLVFLLVSYLVLCYGLSLVFAQAKLDQPSLELKASDAWVPGVNFGKWCMLIGRKPIYALWLLVPLVNVFIYAGMCVDLARSFGRFSFTDAFLSVVVAPLYFIWLGRQADAHYLGPVLKQEVAYAAAITEAKARGEERKAQRLQQESPYKRSSGREWAEAIIFAVSAAALIRLFVFEMFTIPTSSMEGSMLVGDYLVVSKAHYGIRTPQTIAMVPLLHNRLPFDIGESYLKTPSLRMRRLPAIENIDRNDPIVFNFPLGDSVYVTPGRTWSAEDYRVGSVADRSGNAVLRPTSELITRPLDKKDHYVKRAVAVPGDTVEIRNRELYLNGERAQDAPNIQYSYTVTKPGDVRLDVAQLHEWGISNEDLRARGDRGAQAVLAQPSFDAVLNQEQINKLKAVDERIEVVPNVAEPNGNVRMAYRLFPHDPANFPNWTIDNYGPIYVPKAGETVAIGPKNIALYRRIISVYEGHELEVTREGILIDGQPATSYTFEQDYYWAMGDNRHGSEDSRFWGFVPADHIVGKPLFIWFSTRDGNMSNGIRWNRIFKGATQMD